MRDENLTQADCSDGSRVIGVYVRGRYMTLPCHEQGRIIRLEPQPETVRSFAEELRKSPEQLLEQLHAAGVQKEGMDSPLTDADKQKLLSHLQSLYVAGDRKRITLTKKAQEKVRAEIKQEVKEEIKVQAHGESRSNEDKTVCRIIYPYSLRGLFIDDELPSYLKSAFQAIYGFQPTWFDARALRPYIDRLTAIYKAAEVGDREALLHALQQCFEGASPHVFSTLEALVLWICDDYFSSPFTAKILIAWARYESVLSQKKLENRYLRSGNTLAALASWRLRRNKRFFPSCVATIALH
ncbi:hypothetical protein HNP33_003995 [Comamonas odontotermitis]|uniref:Translation initiation factor IF-2 N-terminal domain-containing protein n=1 Tax=Comamonas odontotermitis TaxID=379895 RepID=A0ABR6RL28_9BURK|nr:translation initiation factor IF-2 N-terminal domain-containing protein [Comamonas odontotermitis]MBB6579876.1 hypothetical protein [Comamonas odontotermitis]